MRRRSILAGALVALSLCASGAYAAASTTRTTVVARAQRAAAPAPQAATSRLVLLAAGANGIAIAELSGLAWDANGKLLYGVSDRGELYRFRVHVEGDTLRAVTPAAATPLVDAASGKGVAPSGPRFNAEGLALARGAKGAAELVVALEEDPPAIARFGSDGALLAAESVPAPANAAARYARSKKGKIKHGLEAVALHPVFGILTAPESPLVGQPAGVHTIYAKSHSWSFAGYAPDSRLKGIDVLPDGNLLVLERSRPGASNDVQVASVRRVDITHCAAGARCPTTLLAVLPPQAANFEGMTLLDARHVLLAADDKGGKRGLKTIFALLTLPGNAP